MSRFELSKSRDIGQTIGDPLHFARQNFRELFKFYVFYMAPVIMLFSVAVLISLKPFFLNFLIYKELRDGFDPPKAVFLFTAFLLLLLLSIFQQVYITTFMVEYEKNPELALADVWLALARNWLRILITYLVLVAIFILPPYGIILIRFIASSFNYYITGLLIFAYYAVLLYISIPLSYLIFVRLRERLAMLDALKKCFKLSLGYWWRTFFLMILMSLVIWSLFSIVSLPFYVIQIVKFFHSTSPANDSGIFTGFMANIFTLACIFWLYFLLNLFYIFQGINYFSLSEKKDRLSLRNKIAQIGPRE